MHLMWKNLRQQTHTDHLTTFILKKHIPFNVADVSFRRQRGTAVRLGICWQTIPGPSAMSSCFPGTKAPTEVDSAYLFSF